MTYLQGLMSAWGNDGALDYLKKLAEQEPVVVRGSTVRAQLAVDRNHRGLKRHPINGGAFLGEILDDVGVSNHQRKFARGTVMAGGKASHSNAAKLFIDFTLSKEGQEKLWDFQRIPSRSDVEPKPARLFRGYKRYVVHPEEMQNLDETAKLYSHILKTR